MARVCWLIFLAAFLPQSFRDEIASAGRFASPPAEVHSHELKNVTADFPTSHERTVSRAVSALGDPRMRSDKVRVAVEGWNFCNRAGNLSDTLSFGTLGTRVRNKSASPRWADCTDLVCDEQSSANAGANACRSVKRITEADIFLSPGDPFPTGDFENSTDPDVYAIEKEKYLGSRCADHSGSRAWSFWMIMLKNGNFDESSGLCPIARNLNVPSNSYIQGSCGSSFYPCSDKSGFPCFGYGCMNQPLVVHNWSETRDGAGSEASLTGGIYGTYDLDQANLDQAAKENISSSFFSVSWHKNEVGGSWQFKHVLRVSRKYPWLMLYLRADATSGPSGGYPWDTRGMLQTVPRSPNFTVVLTLNITRGGGAGSQFYLLDIGGCWKNNGKKCDGNLAEDVTRYSEMIINPDITAWCGPNSLQNCPPFHTTVNGTRIPRTDTQNFPYSAYHYYCVPYNALYAEAPYSVCDPFSNPQPQELQQLLPHPEWALHGYPSKQGEGWVGDARTWQLDTGGLSSRLYFYQDPDTRPAKRKWPSIDVGPEVFTSGETETAEWTVSDFNVLIPSD